MAWGNRGRLASAPVAAQLSRAAGWQAVSFALAALLPIGLASFDGGFYPLAWGVGGLAAGSVALGVLVGVKRIELGKRELALLGALTGLVAWIALTAVQPGAATAAAPELERGLFYLAVLWAALLVLRRDSVAACLAGLLTGAVAVACAALARYLLPASGAPNLYQGRLLYLPLGYANATGIFAGMAIVLALCFAAHAPSLLARSLAAGALVPLVATLAFTESRASVAAVALAVGLVAVLDPCRRLFAATAAVALPLPLLAVWASSRTQVADSHAAPAVVTRDGHVIAALIVVLTLALVALAHVVLADRGRVRRESKVGLVALWAGGVALAFGAVLAVARGAGGTGDRLAYWRAAWHDYLQHPVLGSGAGSFGTAWLHYRTLPTSTLDAHNLYLETLAELGPAGLALLLVALALPLTAVRAARRRDPFAVSAAAAYVAFLVHAAVDWDWEMPAVTLVAFLCAAVVLKAAGRTRAVHVRGRTRVVCVVLTSAVTALTAAGLVGNRALTGSASAAGRGDWASAQRLARAAERWQPWSAEPPYLLGEAQLAAGDPRAARQSFLAALRRDDQDWRSWYELAQVSPSARGHAVVEIARLNPLAVSRVDVRGHPSH